MLYKSNYVIVKKNGSLILNNSLISRNEFLELLQNSKNHEICFSNGKKIAFKISKLLGIWGVEFPYDCSVSFDFFYSNLLSELTENNFCVLRVDNYFVKQGY